VSAIVFLLSEVVEVEGTEGHPLYPEGGIQSVFGAWMPGRRVSRRLREVTVMPDAPGVPDDQRSEE
jgi:hypothetical protein